MADEKGSLKRQREETSSESDTEDKVVEAEFLFNDPVEDDTDGILTLLQGSLKVFEWDLPGSLNVNRYSYLSKLVSNQRNLGTLIKTEEDKDSYVMAVLSVLNLKQYEDLNTLAESLIKAAESYGSKDNVKLIKDVLTHDENQVGLIVNERVSNLPSQLIGKLHECVQEDIKWSCLEADGSESVYYIFTHLIGISRLYTHNPNAFNGDEENIVYLKPEEQFFTKNAIVKFMWPTGESYKVDTIDDQLKGPESDVAKERFGNKRGKKQSEVIPEYMFVYCLPFNKYNSIVKQIAKAFKS